MSASGGSRVGGVVKAQRPAAAMDYSQYATTSKPKKSGGGGGGGGGGGIFDRLTDSSLYTGAHKARFNADGTGRGLGGRDRVVKGGGSHGASRNATQDARYYRGSTNTGTNQVFHDSSEFLTRR
eukprot:g1764.t1